MRPVLFTLSLGGRELGLRTYGVLIALGFTFGIVLAWREGKRQGLEGSKILDLAFWMLVAGLVGSRATFVALNLGELARTCAGDGSPRTLGAAIADCTQALRIWEGGLVFYGGVIGACVATAFFARRHRWSFWQAGDVFAPGLALGHAFGRLGCFAAGCCFGKMCASSICVSFPVESVAHEELRQAQVLGAAQPFTPPLHPTQLYEAGAELAIFLLLLLARRRKRAHGEIMLAYVISYAAARSLIEVFRGDTARRFVAEIITPRAAAFLGLPPAEPLLLSVAQALSLVLVVAAAAVLIARRRQVYDATKASNKNA